MIASENRRGDNLHQIRVGQINQHDKISEIIPLLQESWPKMSKDYIKWKCSGSLFGIGAWDKQLIGFVGIQKRVLQCCTKKGVYPLLQNTCVQKKYRQKGVMTKMITFYANTNDKALADPNQIVLKILSNLRKRPVNPLRDYRKIIGLQQYVKIKNPFIAVQQATKNMCREIIGKRKKDTPSDISRKSLQTLQSAGIECTRTIPSDAINVCTAWNKEQGVYVFHHKDTQFLRWRYEQCPHPYYCLPVRSKKKLVGMIFFTNNDYSGEIFDIIIKKSFEQEIATTIKRCVQIMKLSYWTMQLKNPYLEKILRNAGFYKGFRNVPWVLIEKQLLFQHKKIVLTRGDVAC